jgi:FKBP-type peptidyl-prolyl cis-trans isomerase 2
MDASQLWETTLNPETRILAQVTISDTVEADEITIDGNHELADKVLHFDVEVVEVRDATDEELNLPNCGGGCGGCSGDCSDGSCGGCGGCH